MRSWTLLLVGAMTVMLAAAPQAEEADWGEVPAEQPSDPGVAEVEAWNETPPTDPGEAATHAAVPADGAVPAEEPLDVPADALADDEQAELAAEQASAESAEQVDVDAALDAPVSQDAASEEEWAEAGSEASPMETQGVSDSQTVAGPYVDDPAAHLGPQAVDENGVQGRIHTVVPGDTLWDISAAYLGTPWVWPGVWEDNDAIENPHVINPGDRIWITAGEMRLITDEEAARMLDAHDQMISAPANDAPVFEEGSVLAEEDLMDDQVPASMDQLPATVPMESGPSQNTGATVRISQLESMGFITSDELEAATSIIDSPSPRTFLVAGDMIYTGLGEGQTQVGDEYRIFRDITEVRDVNGGHLLGYHVEVLGWGVVREIEGESSIVEIRMSQGEMERGDRLVPRQAVNLNVPIKFSPEGVDGNIVYLPHDRTLMGDGDYLYLNRGALHGYEVGSALEVVYPGELEKDFATGEKVMTPDHIVGKVVLVDVRPDSSVGFVVRASVELEVGDVVRPARSHLAKNQ